MGKMRIHELAKELGKSSGDILSYFESKGEKKTASSGLDDSQIADIKKYFGKSDTSSSVKSEIIVEKPKNDKAKEETSAKKSEDVKAAEPVKKKKISYVSNSKNNRGNVDNKGNRQVGQIGGANGKSNAAAGEKKNATKPVDVLAAFNRSLGVEESKPKTAEKPVQTENAEKKQTAPVQPIKKEPEVRGPKILRHEEISTGNSRKDNSGKFENKGRNDNREGRNNGHQRNDNRGRNDGFVRNDDSSRNSGDQRNNAGKGNSKKGNISISTGGNSFRGSENYSKGQGRDGRKSFGSASGSVPFAEGSSAKNGGKGRGDRKNSDRRKDYDRDEEQQIKSKKFNPHGFHKPEKAPEPEEKIKVITLPEVITIRDLAEKMKIQAAAIIKKLFLEGKMVTVNSEISYEEAENIAIEYEIICEMEEKVDVIAELLKEEEEDESKLISRPPVVCVMGHVDHGKTSLLDAVRKTNVTDREAGGITQHIGAYTVNVNGKSVTFLDTPGHEAFTAMRMRGANSTDIAILVVAADDGVMPQTEEAINHAKAAGVEIIVAVNKIDKPSANVDRVKQELAEHELIAEDWGGSTTFVEVSAKTGQGIEDLLEMVTLTADVLELKANPKRRARGLVIEAELDKGRGPVATVLVQKGTLHVGDFVAAGSCHGKVRAMIDDKGRRVKEAGPSTPVEILGLDDVPNAGEIFISPESDKEAKNFADTFIAQNRQKLLDDTKQRMTLDDVFSQIKEGNLKELNIIVKADVQGSVEAVKTSLLKLSNDEVVVKVIHSGVGAINESDVILASASNAIIIGFNVRPDATAKSTAETEGVDVRLYRVIYQAIEDVEAAMKGMLDPIFEEKVIGHAEVRQIFKASGVGNIAGSYVLDGVFERGCKVRISREGNQIFEGDLASLKRFKDDVKEVKSGFECGLVFDGFGDMQEFDIVEAYKMVEVPRT